MVEIIHAGGRLIRAARYIDSRGEAADDALLDPADGCLRPRAASAGTQREVLDLGPLTVLPGLVDCHVHLSLPPPRLGDDAGLTMAGRLAACLEYGLTAVRDGGDRLGATFDLKKGRELPRLVACGPALHPTGSYGSFLGPASPPEEIAGRVAELATRGADQIKVLVTGPVNLKSEALIDPPHFAAETLSRLVGAAHRRGLKVMAHANGVPGVRMALACGVDSLEHGYGMDEDTLDFLAQSGATWVPTLVPMAALAEKGPPSLRETAASTLARQTASVSRALKLGVPLAVGTDAGAPGVVHGASYLRELQLLGKAGCPPASLIRAATYEGARLLGLRNHTLIAVDGDPLADLATLGRVRAVITNGSGDRNSGG